MIGWAPQVQGDRCDSSCTVLPGCSRRGPSNSSPCPNQAAAWGTEHHNKAGIQLRYCAPSSLLLLTAGPGAAVHEVPPQDWAGFDFHQALGPNPKFELRTETGAYNNESTCHCDVPVVGLHPLPRAHCPPHRLPLSTLPAAQPSTLAVQCQKCTSSALPALCLPLCLQVAKLTPQRDRGADEVPVFLSCPLYIRKKKTRCPFRVCSAEVVHLCLKAGGKEFTFDCP